MPPEQEPPTLCEAATRIPADSSPDSWQAYYQDLAAVPVPRALPASARRGLEIQLRMAETIPWRSTSALRRLKGYHRSLTTAEARDLAALDSWVGSTCS